MAIVNGLITLADAKLSLNIATATTTYDTDLERYIEAATPVIENITGPVLPVSATYTFNGGRRSVNLPCAARSITSVTESGTAITDYQADLVSGIIYAGSSPYYRYFLSGSQNVVVVAAVGVTTTPANVLLATRELVRHWWQIGRQANRPGTAEAGLGEPSDEWAIPRRVRQLLAPNPGVGGFA